MKRMNVTANYAGPSLSDTCRRIAIVGGQGLGKTTLARRLARRLELPPWHLDTSPFHALGGEPQPLSERLSAVHTLATQPRWIVEGVFRNYSDELLESADVIIWLDHIPWTRAFWRILMRFGRGGVVEVKQQPAARKFTRLRDYRRHLRILFSVFFASRDYYWPRSASKLEDPEALTRAAMARRLSPLAYKVIHCCREADVRAVERSFCGTESAANLNGGAGTEVGPLVSVIVNNYNYGRFVGDAIESVLHQTYGNIEIIVVDDGSTDTSRAVIDTFDDRVTRVYKPNGGQSSALNAGFARSTGDIVMFLDADDMLLPWTLCHVVEALQKKPNAGKIQFRMEVVDESGMVTRKIKPDVHLPMPSGDLSRQILSFPDDVTRMPTSGNAFSRQILNRLLPVPEEPYGSVGADWYLSLGAPVLGDTVSLDLVGAYFRVHSSNTYERASLDLEQVRQTLGFMVSTRQQVERLAKKEAVAVPVSHASDSVSYVAHRLISLKLDPHLHPVSGDSVGKVRRAGIEAARNRFDVSPLQKVVFVVWFYAMALAPAPASTWLANRFLYPSSRRRVNTLLSAVRRISPQRRNAPPAAPAAPDLLRQSTGVSPVAGSPRVSRPMNSQPPGSERSSRGMRG